MTNSFNNQLHIDALNSDDQADYIAWCDMVEARGYINEETPQMAYVNDDEADRELAAEEAGQALLPDTNGEYECEECGDYDEYDGQPDEAQEWYDFDPYC